MESSGGASEKRYRVVQVMFHHAPQFVDSDLPETLIVSVHLLVQNLLTRVFSCGFPLPPAGSPGLRLRDHRLTGDRREWIPRGRLPLVHPSPTPEGKNLRRPRPARRGLRAIVKVAA